jgi:hypothetical protein
MTAPTGIRFARQVNGGDTDRGRCGEPLAARTTGNTRRPAAAEPVFVDRTGRRRGLVAAGAAATLVLTLMLLALVAGFTGIAAPTMPGWPAADGHPRPTRAVPQRTDPAPTAASSSTATVTRRTSPRPADSGRHTGSDPTTTASSTAAPVPPTPESTRPGNGHGRNPSHTPIRTPPRNPDHG